MINKYKMGDQTWYDIRDYGMEGEIEGMSYQDLLRLADEIQHNLDGKEPYVWKPTPPLD